MIMDLHTVWSKVYGNPNFDTNIQYLFTADINNGLVSFFSIFDEFGVILI